MTNLAYLARILERKNGGKRLPRGVRIDPATTRVRVPIGRGKHESALFVVQKIAVVKLAPDQPNATEVTLAAFMESLRGEQLERLKGVLSPEQLAVMFSLYEQAQKTAEQ